MGFRVPVSGFRVHGAWCECTSLKKTCPLMTLIQIRDPKQSEYSVGFNVHCEGLANRESGGVRKTSTRCGRLKETFLITNRAAIFTRSEAERKTLGFQGRGRRAPRPGATHECCLRLGTTYKCYLRTGETYRCYLRLSTTYEAEGTWS